jgi:hypothetical protein
VFRVDGTNLELMPDQDIPARKWIASFAEDFQFAGTGRQKDAPTVDAGLIGPKNPAICLLQESKTNSRRMFET